MAAPLYDSIGKQYRFGANPKGTGWAAACGRGVSVKSEAQSLRRNLRLFLDERLSPA